MTEIPQKRTAPSALRNQASIGEHLQTQLPQNAHVLEIASGTGQHGAYITGLRPDIIWQYSDIDAQAHASQKAYASETPDQLKAPLNVDVTQEKWWQDLTSPTNLYCANMIHIAPWAAAQGLAKGAGALLKCGGKTFLYGPFLRDENSVQSNINFAQNLMLRNSVWGVRELSDVEKVFADNRFQLDQNIDMPRDNSLLVFVKT